MSRRISIPDDHVALLLPTQLADELQSLMRIQRLRMKTILARKNAKEEDKHVATQEAAIAGDILLAILEAKES